MTNVKLVTDQGEWELPDGDFLFLMLNTRAVSAQFGAEMVGSSPPAVDAQRDNVAA